MKTGMKYYVHRLHVCVCVCVCVLQREVLGLQKSIQGSSFDTEYAIKYVLLCIFFARVIIKYVVASHVEC